LTRCRRTDKSDILYQIEPNRNGDNTNWFDKRYTNSNQDTMKYVSIENAGPEN